MSYSSKVSIHTISLFLNSKTNISKYYLYEMEEIVIFTKHLAQNPEKLLSCIL